MFDTNDRLTGFSRLCYDETPAGRFDKRQSENMPPLCTLEKVLDNRACITYWLVISRTHAFPLVEEI